MISINIKRLNSDSNLDISLPEGSIVSDLKSKILSLSEYKSNDLTLIHHGSILKDTDKLQDNLTLYLVVKNTPTHPQLASLSMLYNTLLAHDPTKTTTPTPNESKDNNNRIFRFRFRLNNINIRLIFKILLVIFLFSSDSLSKSRLLLLSIVILFIIINSLGLVDRIRDFNFITNNIPLFRYDNNDSNTSNRNILFKIEQFVIPFFISLIPSFQDIIIRSYSDNNTNSNTNTDTGMDRDNSDNDIGMDRDNTSNDDPSTDNINTNTDNDDLEQKITNNNNINDNNS